MRPGEKKENDPEGYGEWLSSHDDCRHNHNGSVAKMEVDSVKDVFARSLENYNVKYTCYIGDGDSATFEGILDLNPYEVPVEKLECYLHVKKRMGTRCEKKKVKGLGRRSNDTEKLTDKTINKLQKYYDLAILRHQDSVEEMYKEIWATYFHMGSTNNKPQYQNCPVGADI